MVDMSAPYVGDYVKSSELPPNVRIPVTILFAGIEQVGQDQKLAAVLSLANAETKQAWPRKVILNKTNAGILTAAFGKDSAAWTGQAITVWADPDVIYMGERVGGMKVAVGHQAQPVIPGGAIPLPGPVHQAPAVTAPTPPPSAGNGAAAAPAAAQTMNMGGHEVPLPTGMPSAPPNPARPVWAGPGSDLDDEIPL